MGEKLGKYAILAELGRGGMGVVYRAVDPSQDREVALKELILALALPDAEKTETIERFKREGMAAMRLKHPNIVTVYEMGNDGERYFMAMELVEGKSLGHYIDQKTSFSCQQVVDIGVQICSALDYAHQQGVVHRDIKPDNIQIQGNGQVKLMDFGVARVKSDLPGLTQTGTTLGTIAYISPEQLTDSRDVDGRADIFSLGALFYEMLTFRTPFDAGNLGGTILRIMNETPEPLTKINPNVPAKLESVVLKALKKNREERFQRAADMQYALQDALRGVFAPNGPIEAPALVPCRFCQAEMPPSSKVCPTCGRSAFAGGAGTSGGLGSFTPTSAGKGATGALAAGNPQLTAPMPANRPQLAPPATPIRPQLSMPPSALRAKPAPGSEPAANPVPPAVDRPRPVAPPGHPLAAPHSRPPMQPVQPEDPAARSAAISPGAEPASSSEQPARPLPAPQLVMKAAQGGTASGAPAAAGIRVPPGPATQVAVAAKGSPIVLKFAQMYGKGGLGPGAFNQNRGIAVDNRGRLYVADTENGRVQVFETSGNLLVQISAQSVPDGFHFPKSVAIAPQGVLYISDDLDHRIFKFDWTGKPLGVWKRSRTGQVEPAVPGQVLIAPSGQIYLSEPSNRRVLVYDAKERQIATISVGLLAPAGMALDARGRLYVVDSTQSTINIYNDAGMLETTFGQKGTGAGQFSVPRAIAVDRNGNLYVADTLNHRIQVFDSKGNHIVSVGTKGTEPSEFNSPEGLVVGSGDHLYVADRGNGRVQVFVIERHQGVVREVL